MIRHERKALLTPAATVLATTTANISLINDTITQGEGIAQREGARYRMLGLQLRGYWFAPTLATAPPYSATVRMMIVYDRQPTGALPVYSDIFGAVTTWQSFQLPSTRDRMYIVQSFVKQVTMEYSGDAGAKPNYGSQWHVPFEFDIPLNLPTTYKDVATGAIADIVTGALYLVLISDWVGASGPGVLMCAQLQFADI